MWRHRVVSNFAPPYFGRRFACCSHLDATETGTRLDHVASLRSIDRTENIQHTKTDVVQNALSHNMASSCRPHFRPSFLWSSFRLPVSNRNRSPAGSCSHTSVNRSQREHSTHQDRNTNLLLSWSSRYSQFRLILLSFSLYSLALSIFIPLYRYRVNKT